MNQFELQYIYTYKSHKETPCIAILNKQIVTFFLLQNQRTEGQNKSCWGKGSVPEGREGCEERV
jgi:hypothetical protein